MNGIVVASVCAREGHLQIFERRSISWEIYEYGAGIHHVLLLKMIFWPIVMRI